MDLLYKWKYKKLWWLIGLIKKDYNLRIVDTKGLQLF